MISWPMVEYALPPPSAALAAAASLRSFLISATRVLLSLIHWRLILSA